MMTSLYQDLHFWVDRHFKLVLPITVPQWQASTNTRESFRLSSHSLQWNVSTWLAMHLSNGIAQQSVKNQVEASHSGHGNAFSLTVYCDRHSLVIRGNHKALLSPCTHQYATSALAQLPSLLSPSHTSVTIQSYLPLMFLVRPVLILKIHFIMDLQTSPLPPLKIIFAIF